MKNTNYEKMVESYPNSFSDNSEAMPRTTGPNHRLNPYIQDRNYTH